MPLMIAKVPPRAAITPQSFNLSASISIVERGSLPVNRVARAPKIVPPKTTPRPTKKESKSSLANFSIEVYLAFF